MKILIIEDEQLLADSIAEVLRRKGFEAEAVYDGETGAEYAELGVYDLLILDVMMPGLDGYTVARQVRARHLGTPILMLTARSGLEDRITGLNAGADYYLTKPFDTRELLACVNALLRRQGAQVNQLTLGNTSLDLSTAALSCGADSIRLSAREFDIMRLLLQAGERNLSKAALLERVWGVRLRRGGKPCGGLRLLSAEKARQHRLQHPHRVHPPAGLPPGGERR